MIEETASPSTHKPKIVNESLIKLQNQNLKTNTVDSDEAAHYELSHLVLKSLQKQVLFYLVLKWLITCIRFYLLTLRSHYYVCAC